MLKVQEKEQAEFINDRYLATLKEVNSWVTISEWAQKVALLNPDLIEKANRQAAGQKQETTGLREIAARLSSQTSRGAFGNNIEIDVSERPKRVRWVSTEEAQKNEDQELEEDLEPLGRDQIIKTQEQEFSLRERYRSNEFDAVARQFNLMFETDFEVDHAKAILNKIQPGQHHPDNFQILTKSHNRKKNATNWKRFSLVEQIDYIKSVIATQKIISKNADIDIQEDVVGLLIDRIKKVF
jgi:hypothetical protein